MRISNIGEISDHSFLLLDSGLLTPIGLLFQLQSDCTFTFVLKYSFVFFNYLPSSLFSSYKMNNPLLVDIESFTEYAPGLIHRYSEQNFFVLHTQDFHTYSTRSITSHSRIEAANDSPKCIV